MWTDPTKSFCIQTYASRHTGWGRVRIRVRVMVMVRVRVSEPVSSLSLVWCEYYEVNGNQMETHALHPKTLSERISIVSGTVVAFSG